jgi:hypothetical protein
MVFIRNADLRCIRAILERKDLRAPIKAMAVAIAMNHDFRHDCYLSVDEIRAQAGCARKTAYNMVRRMQEIGVLTVNKPEGKFSKPTYRLETCPYGEIQA